jgi:hypothetical protein
MWSMIFMVHLFLLLPDHSVRAICFSVCTDNAQQRRNKVYVVLKAGDDSEEISKGQEDSEFMAQCTEIY